MIVLWRVTGRCNLACGFCAYDRRLAGVRRVIDEATVERFGRLLGEYQRHTGQEVHLSWLGGEPLLWPALWSACETLGRAGLRLSATTNGSTLGQAAVRERVLAHLAELTVSIDGPAAFHDAVRGWRGGWLRLRDSLQALAHARDARGSSFKLRVNTVLMAQNAGDFPALCETLAAWGVDEICFNALGGRDRPEFFPAHRLKPEHVHRLQAELPALRQRLRAHGTRLLGSGHYLARLAANAGDLPLPVEECAPGERFLFLDEHGRMSPCSFTTAEYGLDVRSLRTLDDLLALAPQWRAARHRAPRAQACADCRANHVYDKFEA